MNWGNQKLITLRRIIFYDVFYGKYKGFGLQTPPVGPRTGSKKISFLEAGLRSISYRLSHEWARSVNPLKTFKNIEY
jgi:hypothetical protein